MLNDKFGIVKGHDDDDSLLHERPAGSRPAAQGPAPCARCCREHHSVHDGRCESGRLVLPELKGKLNGMAFRVPTPNVSVTDLVAELESRRHGGRSQRCVEGSCGRPAERHLDYSDEPLVSSDYNGDPASSTIDALSTMVVDGNMVKVVSWYDNEWGYSNRVVDLAALHRKQRSVMSYTNQVESRGD